MHCSLIMHGFHNGKWLILCSKHLITGRRYNLLVSRLAGCGVTRLTACLVSDHYEGTVHSKLRL